ncbi:MAG: hypothetical protein ACPGWR_21995, partial [Ardenticatenaceae bacterium]
ANNRFLVSLGMTNKSGVRLVPVGLKSPSAKGPISINKDVSIFFLDSIWIYILVQSLIWPFSKD